MSLSMMFAECLSGLPVPVVKFIPKFNNVFYEESFPKRCLLQENDIRERLTKANFDFSHEFFISEHELIKALGKIKTYHATEQPRLER